MTLCRICLWPIPRTRKKKTMRESRALCSLCLSKKTFEKTKEKHCRELTKRWLAIEKIRAAREVAK